MTAKCLLLASLALLRYLGVVVLDVVRGERVLNELMTSPNNCFSKGAMTLRYVHVRTINLTSHMTR
jgi:hypothetical protein